ncbi:MAG: patatin-like phospholipase family protein [Cyclobacteriaceae bacterium]
MTNLKILSLYINLFCFLIFSGNSAFALDTLGVTRNNDRPKIGLVLSGGGAKGMAHIGVIKVLEEAGIIPDYITGTSMGSIVGALYAIGYSPAEIDSIARTMDWAVLLSNKIDLYQVAIEEKPNYGRFLTEFPINEKGLALPKGLIEGQKLTEALNRLTRVAHQETDFNKFPIPFACVGADLEKGEHFVMNHGFLPEAIRASMAIPSIFTPVIVDDRFLVDGGLIRNFPVQECIDMGADIIIGVNVASGFDSRDQLNSLVAIMSSSAFVMSVIDTRQQIELCDFLVSPNLEGYTTGDFFSTDSIIQRGENTARNYLEDFKLLADTVYQGNYPSRANRPKQAENYAINNISVRGNQRIHSDLIIRKLQLEKGSLVPIADVERNLSRLYGTRYFDRINYRIIQQDSLSNIEIDVIESDPGTIGAGLYYNTDGFFGLNLAATYRNLWLPNSKGRAEAVFSDQYKLSVAYLKYLGQQQNKVLEFEMHASEDMSPLYNSAREKTAEYGSFWWEPSINFINLTQRNLQYGWRLKYLYANLSPRIADDESRRLQKAHFRQLIPELYVERNTLDRWYFPTKGMFWRLSTQLAFDLRSRVKLMVEVPDPEAPLDEQGTIDEIQQFDLNIGNQFMLAGEFYNVRQLTKKTFIEMHGQMHFTSLDVDEITPNRFVTGGINPQGYNALMLYGARAKEYLLANFFYTRVSLRHNLSRNLYLSTHLNYVNSEYPSRLLYKNAVRSDMNGQFFRFGAAMSVGFNSLIGPIQLSIASDLGDFKLLPALQLGYAYRFPTTRPWFY